MRIIFPVVLTHRLAVTQAVADTLCTIMVNGMGVDPFTIFTKENHTRKHCRKELPYMARLAELLNDVQVGSERVTAAAPQQAYTLSRISLFKDPFGYNWCDGPKMLYQQLYTRIMDDLEAPMKKHSAMIPAACSLATTSSIR